MTLEEKIKAIEKVYIDMAYAYHKYISGLNEGEKPNVHIIYGIDAIAESQIMKINLFTKNTHNEKI